MLQKFICMRGKEAAQLFYDNEFYDNERFKRKGAAPQRLKKTLFGQGSVQGMDGTPHRGRKQMFMSLMTPEGIGRLVNLTSDQWRTYFGQWENQNSVVLFDEVREPLCRAVCAWAGVPLKESEVELLNVLRPTIDVARFVTFAALGPPRIPGMPALPNSRFVISNVRRETS